MGTDYPVVFISWDEYEELAQTIVNAVRCCDIDFVVPVLRGGVVLGLTVANRLNLPMCYIGIKRSVSNRVNSDFSDPEYLGGIGLNKIAGKKVMVCEDTIDTERTISDVVRRLKQYKPQSVQVATLYNFSKNESYISGYRARQHFWVVFPWER